MTVGSTWSMVHRFYIGYRRVRLSGLFTVGLPWDGPKQVLPPVLCEGNTTTCNEVEPFEPFFSVNSTVLSRLCPKPDSQMSSDLWLI